MSELQNKIKELLESGKANIVIGYAEGVGGNVRPFFTATPAEAEKFIFDQRCRQNLATYIHKAEIKAIGKIAVVAVLPGIKTLLQLAGENQIKDGQIIALVVSPDGKVSEMSSFADMENFVTREFPIPEAAKLARQRMLDIMAMPREQRWELWQHEMQNCIKCFACRSACPLCYCTQCTVESNQPQWIPVAAHNQGNLEWHIIRAMHLAGRCIGCGECTRACPMGIPVGLFSMLLNNYTQETFGQTPGMKATIDYAYGTFKADDKENFIR